jgi:hypothetical protein
MPFAIFAKVLQLKGAIKIHQPMPKHYMVFPSVIITYSVITLFLDNVESTNGETNSLAVGVITTLTSAPALINNLTSKIVLYAAILAVIPINIFFCL